MAAVFMMVFKLLFLSFVPFKFGKILSTGMFSLDSFSKKTSGQTLFSFLCPDAISNEYRYAIIMTLYSCSLKLYS